MNSLLAVALVGLFQCSSFAIAQVRIESKFVEVRTKHVPHDITKLNQLKGVDLLSAPVVVTRSGQKADIEIVREHHPQSLAPSRFPAVPLGVKVSVTPSLKGDTISYTAQLTVTDLVSSKSRKGVAISETVTRSLYVSGVSKSGKEVWFDYIEPINGRKMIVWLLFKRVGG